MDFKESKKKAVPGFTLIELLIVVAIIGVLSTLAVNGYTQYRRSTLLDLSADNIVAQLYELRDDTLHGDFGGGRYDDIKAALEDDEDVSDELFVELDGAKCYGVYFSSDGVPRSYEFEYDGKRIWNPGSDVFEYVECEDTFDPNDPEAGVDLELDDEVSIVEISDSEGSSLADFRILFVPPNGEVEVSSSDRDIADKEFVTLVIKYGVSDEDRFKRKITIDLKSGTAEVNYLE